MKKRTINKIGLLTVTLMLGGAAFAQTTETITINKGELYILPNSLVSTHFDFVNTADGVLINDGKLEVNQDYENLGMVGFTPGRTSGLTIFKGVNHLAAGDSPSLFQNIEFNTTSTANAVRLQNDFVIRGNSYFKRGIVAIDSLSGGAMLFGDQAMALEASDDSFVIGSVEKEGRNQFTFPIGKDDYYRPLGIAQSAATQNYFVSRYKLENPTERFPQENKMGVLRIIDNQEYWELSNTGGQETVIVTLSWHDETTPEELLRETENLRVVRWDSDKNLWVDEGGIVDNGNQTVTTSVPAEGYGVFTLGLAKPNVILPDDVVVYNYVSSNGNDKNDYLLIDNIDRYPNNQLEVFNRYGVKVYETTNYGSNGNVFKGYSEGRATVSGSNKLPSGTYYYILVYEKTDNDGVSQRIKKVGYIHLEND